MKLPVAVMTTNHRKICEAVCTLWKGGKCQRPLVAEVMGEPDPDLCVRTMAESQILARARASYSKN